jgi:hypothetical protein
MSIHVDIIGQTIPPDAEVARYVARTEDEMRAGRLPADIGRIEIEVQGANNDEVVLRYYRVTSPKFERIRRITGYLVGTLDRFNDAKRAEEKDRVKHGITTPTMETTP